METFSTDVDTDRQSTSTTSQSGWLTGRSADTSTDTRSGDTAVDTGGTGTEGQAETNGPVTLGEGLETGTAALADATSGTAADEKPIATPAPEPSTDKSLGLQPVTDWSPLGETELVGEAPLIPMSLAQIAPTDTTVTPLVPTTDPAAAPIDDTGTTSALAPTSPTTALASDQSSPLLAPDETAGTNQSTDAASALAAWSANWRAKAATMPCGSCTGRTCYMCSVRIGGPPSSNGLPTGYSPRVLMHYQPTEGATTDGTPVTVPEGAEPATTFTGTSSDATGDVTASAFAAPTLLAAAALPANPNPIVLENQKQGTPESVWLPDSQDDSIEGFAAEFSINHGQTVHFKINTDSTNYRIDIYRLGYYGGDGAHLVTTINRQLSSRQVQPTPLFDPTLKLVDAGNWAVSASWAIPADAVSGVYIAELTRLDGDGGRNLIPFIVRDDNNPSAITFQTSDTTWQAYNWWGGYNLYGGIDAGGRAGRASAVSYNRPIITRDGGFDAGPQDYVFGVEYPAIRWLEQNGYDVNYISGVDTARDGAQLLNSQVFLSVGHDEYWSGDQRDNVEAARDAGVNLAFLSGNEVYWAVRWAPSIDGSGTPYKTMVEYKEIWSNANTDTAGTTSTWRDPLYGPGEPENGLTGTIFTVDSYRLDTIKIPYDLSNFRFWSNTAVANIQPGQVYSLTPNLLGYEWDSDLDNGFRPAGLINLSSTTVNVDTLLIDNGVTTGPGTATHALTLYRAPSGALVFGAGSVYWSWGLDSHHDNETTPTDPNVQQAMVNLFADMGVQPQTLMQSLAVAQQTTDHTAPTSTIAAVGPGSTFAANSPVTVTGTATDAGGGLVAVVEVSSDNGQTWHRATGFNNWTYTFTPLAGGSYTIRSRAVDDSVNMETPSSGRTISVAPAPSVSLFRTTDTPAVTSDVDPNRVNVGMRFTSSQPGQVVGIRYYRGLGDGGTHIGALWSATGTRLASATFTNETTSGWQTVIFDNPVTISAGTTYVASYLSNGHYADTENYFSAPVSNGPLTAQANNGFFTYASNLAFPTNSSGGVNYWVDVLFSPTQTANQPPVGVNDNGFTTPENTPITFAAATLLANDTDPNGDALTITGAGSASGGTVAFNSQTGAITFTPATDFTGAASFGYSISDGRGGTGSANVNLTVTPPVSGVSLFSASDTPANLSDPDNVGITLGVRFSASGNGTIQAIRYYKGANDAGTHTGSLWTATGTLLGTATFTNETASGWQTAVFANPINIAANTTYVASYHSNGHYTSTGGYFNTSHANGPLTAPVNAGVYTYGTGNLFPTSTFGGTNYWVDVVYASTSSGTNRPPVASNDSGFTTAQNTALQIAAAALLANDSDPDTDPLTITGVSGASNGTVAFNTQTNVVTFTPANGYTGPAAFTYAISDGRGGTASAGVSLSVTAAATGVSLFPAGSTPAIVNSNDSSPVELGMKFSVASNGTINGVRFYKGTANTGTHTGSLWTAAGALLGTVTFSNETASGWQTATFANPVPVTAGTNYVVGYHTSGFYSANTSYFTAPVTANGITAPTNAGVYAYGTGTPFPNNVWNASNYWVDVLYQPAAQQANQPPVANADSGFSTARDTALQLAAAALLANDTDPNGDTLTITGVSGATNGTVVFNAQNNVVTFTPTGGYTGPAGFTYAISDGRGGTASAAVSLSVTAAPTNVSLFSPGATPGTISENDPNPVELGMKFSSSVNGAITGVRFYKGPLNTGTHTGSLWTTTGTRLGTVTFTNETASGWQSANFATPVAITAGTTYIVSYHSNGRYSADNGFFNNSVTNGPLTAPSSASSGGNGVYAYGSSSLFPNSTYNASNYWVDVMFNGQLAA